MQLTQLEIHNFRGIKNCSIVIPLNTHLICMIGPGDGTKSTLLKAIEWILWPSWNLSAIDTDFYNSDTSVPIILRGTFSGIPTSLLSEDKFGLYLRRNEVPIKEGADDEPKDGQPVCLTLQLTIDASLEPKWEVLCNRKEPKVIPYKERQLLSVGSVGSNCQKDMVWSRFSVLQKYANSKGILQEAVTEILRKAADDVDFQDLDKVSSTISSVGNQYGVELSKEIKSKLFIQNNALSSSIGLFEDGAPLSQRGLGSQRLLSMGLNINATSDGTLLLIDEVETGLEPYRIKSLINEFRVNHGMSGQIIMTTHSPVVVAECRTSELFIIQSKDGITTAYPLHNIEGETNEIIQRELRRNPEAFLCKRIIVCEGKTEIGFVRALDNFISQKYQFRMACEGVGTALGGGDQVFDCAIFLASRGYDVCVFMDSDLDGKGSEKEETLKVHRVNTYDWDVGNSIEEQFFFDSTTSIVEEMIQIAVDEKSIETITIKLKDIPYTIEEGTIKLDDTLTPIQRKQIGTISKQKKSAWYKRIDLGEELGNVIFRNWQDINKSTTLYKTIDKLITWVRIYE